MRKRSPLWHKRAIYTFCQSFVSSVSPACRKRRLIGAVCRNLRIKRLVPCRCRAGTLKNSAKCLWRWEPDRSYNYFFFSPSAHLCAVTCMTEISLILTLTAYGTVSGGGQLLVDFRGLCSFVVDVTICRASSSALLCRWRNNWTCAVTQRCNFRGVM